MSGADLQNLVNQAAVKASRDGAKWVDLGDFEWAKDRIMMGAERKSHFVTDEAKKMTAYHEGGHALVALLTPGAMPLHKVTVLPRGQALGIVSPSLFCDSASHHDAMQIFLLFCVCYADVPIAGDGPRLVHKDRVPCTKSVHPRPTSPNFSSWSLTRLPLPSPFSAVDVAMGGRVAEELIYGKENVTSGAHSDLVAASNVANEMVKSMGYSDKVGLVAHGDEAVYLSERKKDEIESEVRRSVPCLPSSTCPASQR
jgi:ATP-dependent Zn protease